MKKNFSRLIASHHEALLILAAALMLTSAGKAHADGTWDDCIRVLPMYEYYPNTIVELGRDAQIGDVVGPWIQATAMPAWTCTRRTGQGGTAVNVSAQGYPPYGAQGTVELEGQSYTYYRLATNNPAVAYIARWRVMVDGTYTEWTPLNVAAGVYQTPASMVSVVKAVGETYTIGLETQIRLVKQTNTLNPSTVQNLADTIYTRHYQQVGSSISTGGGTYRISQIRGGTATFGTAGTCTTPDVSVSLPETPVDEFSGADSTAAITPFELSFNNCPPGLATVQYSLGATTSVIDESNGIVALDGTSTATGVGIQVSQGDGSALRINQRYPVKDYDSSQQGSYKVGLRAGFYQTGTTVVAGSASTALILTAFYK